MTLPGAHPDPSGTTFVAWSTTARDLAVRFFEGSAEGAPTPTRTEPLDALGGGRFAKHLPGVRPGALYKLVVDGDETPDPYARFLPFGVHGPARVVAPSVTAPLAEPAPLAQWVIYELHVGTFTREGTYRGATAKLDELAALGITAIELLPLAAFPGEWGWGYDGVALYAPFAPYGELDDLRAFIDGAHARGIAVLLDVVYNHFGPAGNYLWRYSAEYFTKAVETPWGPAPDYAHARMRSLALDNARYWLEELGFDGLRVDATHAIHDASPKHVLREITELAHAMTPPRRIFFEDERNEPAMVTEMGADGVWADDFHHQLHVLLTGESDGYYSAYRPTVESLALSINEGWTFTGQPYPPWQGKPRGSSARERGIEPEHLVYCLQNHDQVGNRALGTRLSAHTDVDAFCAASLLLLALPAMPLVFMGQEWGASTPFLFFSDHEGDLGEAVRKGRREEFKTFEAFAHPETRGAIPDPQARATFESSKLRWEEREHADHSRVLGLYRAMISLRRTDAVLGAPSRWEDLEAKADGKLLEVLRRKGSATRRVLVSFDDAVRDIGDTEGWSLLHVTGSYEGGKLGPRSAIVLARD